MTSDAIIYVPAFISGLILLMNYYYVKKNKIQNNDIKFIANFGVGFGFANVILFILRIIKNI